MTHITAASCQSDYTVTQSATRPGGSGAPWEMTLAAEHQQYMNFLTLGTDHILQMPLAIAHILKWLGGQRCLACMNRNAYFLDDSVFEVCYPPTHSFREYSLLIHCCLSAVKRDRERKPF